MFVLEILNFSRMAGVGGVVLGAVLLVCEAMLSRTDGAAGQMSE